MKEKGIVITAEDKISLQEFDRPLHRSLGKAVGGYIEVVHPVGIKHPFLMVVNEDGLRLELPLNAIGSVLYGTLAHGHPIVGDIVIMKEGWTEDGPDVVGLTDKEAKDFLNLFSGLLKTVPSERRGENDPQPQ